MLTFAARIRHLAPLALFFVAGCGADERLETAPEPSSPDAPGPYAVGVTTFEVSNGDRTLPVEVWYPAMPGGTVEEYQPKLGVIQLPPIRSPLEAVRDATLDPRGAPYPTVIFSHGNGGIRIQSVYMTEYLATHGFVVAAPDHVGNTFAEQINTAKALAPAKAASLRPIDVSRTLDGVLELSDEPGGILDGAVDEKRVGVAGHSFGGYTALRIAGATLDAPAVLAECAATGSLICEGWENVEMPASQRDARFSAALAQAPGGAQAMTAGNRNGFGDVATVTMIQGGTSDELTPFDVEQRAPFDALKVPAWLVAVDRAGHFTFSDMCLLVETFGLSVEAFEDGCGDANIPYLDAHALINRYATAFFQHTLLGVSPNDGPLDTNTPLPTGITLAKAK